MKRMQSFLRIVVLGVVAMTTLLVTTGRAFADKLYLKDGRVLDGSVVAEGKGWIQFKYSVANVPTTSLFTESDYTKLVKESVTNPAPGTENATDKGDKSDKTDASAKIVRKPGVTRIAILNFGPGSTWSDKVGDMVGVQISAAAFEKVVPILERDKVDVVVIRINSGGGYSIEMEKFQDLFQNVYKKKFRTVAWIESAISAAAMSPWVIEEYYFMRKGNMGACTEWSGRLVASKGVRLQQVLLRMEQASAKGGHDPLIMRAMQGGEGKEGEMQPLSVTKDPATGAIKWYGDASSGKKVINPPGKVLTINALDAYEFGLARGIADTPDELAKVMLGDNAEYEIVAQDASNLIDDLMRQNDKAEKTAVEVAIRYRTAVALARQMQDKTDRAAQVNIAKKQLAQIKKWVKDNPNLQFHLGNDFGALLDDEWFRIQEEMLRDLLK